MDVNDGDSSSPKVHFRDWPMGECAYSEVPVAERDELSSAVARSIYHTTQGHGPRRNQQKKSHYLDDHPSLISS